MACNRFAWLFQIGGWRSEWNFFFNQLIPANNGRQHMDEWRENELSLSFALESRCDGDGNENHTLVCTFFKHSTNENTKWEKSSKHWNILYKLGSLRPMEWLAAADDQNVYDVYGAPSIHSNRYYTQDTTSLRISALIGSTKTTASAIKCYC